VFANFHFTFIGIALPCIYLGRTAFHPRLNVGKTAQTPNQIASPSMSTGLWTARPVTFVLERRCFHHILIRGAPMKTFRTLVTIASCASLAACSSIGTVNGVSLDSNKRMGATETNRTTWCDQDDQHRWICILVAAGAVGGAIAAIASRNHKTPPAGGGPVLGGGGD
jgi:hypothetical protein